MSQVAISGNASGTGVFTIAAPNSNVSYTATLPTGTGTLALGNQVQSISASIASNAITVSATLLTLDFRSTTLTSGTITTVSGTPANLVIASTDSFGLVTAAGSQRIVILAINNAGTIELAATALYGGVNLDEAGVITTAATATTSTAIKAAGVRSGVAYRVIGYIDATFTTGTGWGSLALIQGAGGEAITSLQSLGFGQTWQNVTASRASGTTYYNTTGKPIFLRVYGVNTGANYSFALFVNSLQVDNTGGTTIGGTVSVSAVVPPGATYSCTVVTITPTWYELR